MKTFNSQEATRLIGYDFKDKALLQLAFTHSSLCGAHTLRCNERLEYLGDSVLSLIVSEMLYRTHSNKSEGELTELRKRLVSEAPLAKVVVRCGFADLLLTGDGLTNLSANVTSSLYEAILGAVYLDGGLDSARAFVTRTMGAQTEANVSTPTVDDKSALLELCEKQKRTAVFTVISEQGPPHDKTFTVECTVDGVSLGVGEGKKKGAAQQQAARLALAAMKKTD